MPLRYASSSQLSPPTWWSCSLASSQLKPSHAFASISPSGMSPHTSGSVYSGAAAAAASRGARGWNPTVAAAAPCEAEEEGAVDAAAAAESARASASTPLPLQPRAWPPGWLSGRPQCGHGGACACGVVTRCSRAVLAAAVTAAAAAAAPRRASLPSSSPPSSSPSSPSP